MTTSPPTCAEYHEIWELKPPGTLWATPGLLRDSFTLPTAQWRTEGGVWGVQTPPPEIPKISVESSIA